MWNTLWPWFVFAAVVTILLTLDLAVFHRRGAHREPSRERSCGRALFVGTGLVVLRGGLGSRGGDEAALQYLTAFLIEESLSVDNLFVFLALFAYFGVSPASTSTGCCSGASSARSSCAGSSSRPGSPCSTAFHWLVYLLGARPHRAPAPISPSARRRTVHPETQPGRQLGEPRAADGSHLPRRPLHREASTAASGSRPSCWSCWRSRAPT